ncbi:MAG: hypothetical protein BroJett013_06900 [Alphaproteobacteria bacterium]|nr:MAG: hypothetical protein BroJett013_06900 [Alphaproteobacteria bacterium]
MTREAREKAKFTPGPWRVDNGDVVGANNVMLGSEADLHLIAAAPDLYQALQETSQAMDALIYEGIDRGKGHWPAWDKTARAVDKARAALAKADGAGQ